MKTSILLLLAFFVKIHGNDRHEMHLPPMITKDLETMRYAWNNSLIHFQCEASGKPKYSWYKDGYLITPPGIYGNLEVNKANVLTVSMTSLKDEGVYKCVAHNDYGTAQSNTSALRMASLSVESMELKQTKEVGVNAHDSLKLEWMNKVESTPSPIFTWQLKGVRKDNNGNKNKIIRIKMNERIAMDDDGSLYFSHILKSDEKEGWVYVCSVTNPWIYYSNGIAYIKIHVNDKAAESNVIKVPRLLFASGDKKGGVVEALVGDVVTLKCFYATYPNCSYSWRKLGRKIRGIDGISTSQTYHIRKVVEGDAGAYVCACSNSFGSSNHTIRLIVESKPLMRHADDILRSVNVTEGDAAIFNCRPHSIPPSTLQWSINGVTVQERHLQDRWSMNSDKTQLILRQTRKDTQADKHTHKNKYKDTDNPAYKHTDMAVVGCEVGNTHARYTYSAYLNVLARTRITVPPEDISVEYEGGELEVSFYCSASSDDFTALSLRWIFLPKYLQNVSFHENVHSVEGGIKLENGNKTLVIEVKNSTEWPKHEGTYTCEAHNGYSRDRASADLLVVMPTIPSPIVVSLLKIAASAWLCVLLVVVLLLLLLLCCCYFRAAKSGAYKFDLKEQQNANDPVKELKEDELKYNQRSSPVYTILKNEASLSSAPIIEECMGDDDDNDDGESLNGYADVDVGKFGEDGWWW